VADSLRIRQIAKTTDASWMTVLLSTLLGLLIFKLAIIDCAFRGDMSVVPDAFVTVSEREKQGVSLFPAL
jgi:hypothetical protein